MVRMTTDIRSWYELSDQKHMNDGITYNVYDMHFSKGK